VPERETLMLLYLERGAVLLERRPPTGIWGGLWSLPEADVDADPETLCRARFGIPAARIQRLDPIRHAFTHFRLTIQPVAVWLAGASPRAEECDAMWLRPEQAGEVALPAPLKTILESLGAEESTGNAQAA
jgi:A/G-specific adenine glycosylase